MRKSLLLITAFGSLAALTGLALPAVAGSSDGTSASGPAGEPLDLEAIPVKPVTGPLAVKGVAGDDDDGDDDMPIIGNGVRASAGDDGFRGEGGEGHAEDDD